MNIFVLDRNPITAAQQQCDKHVVKMILESAQMLCTAHRVLDGDEPADRFGLYKKAHTNHPCSIWVRESMHNYRWLWVHMMALGEEYTYRYGKVHKSIQKLGKKLERLPHNIPRGKMTEFKLAMKQYPECMKEDTVESYRLYYQTKQDKFNMVWTNRDIPEWFNAQI